MHHPTCTGKAPGDIFAARAELGAANAHYLRQITISRRRQMPAINRVWCHNRHILASANLWNH